MHIGKQIKEVFDSMPKECTVAWFASQLHCDRRNVYRIFNKENIDIQLLGRISRILCHDFFQDLSGKTWDAGSDLPSDTAKDTAQPPIV